MPFDGPAVAGAWVLIMVAQPEPPSQHRPDLDPALEAICLKAMAKKPEDRYASMAEFAAALGVYLGGQGGSLGTTTAGRRALKNSPHNLPRRPSRERIIHREPETSSCNWPTKIALPSVHPLKPTRTRRWLIPGGIGSALAPLLVITIWFVSTRRLSYPRMRRRGMPLPGRPGFRSCPHRRFLPIRSE